MLMNTQKELIAVSEIPPLRMVEQWRVESCPNRLEALRQTIRFAKLQDCDVADALEIKRSQFSLIMQGKAHFPVNKEHGLMYFCQNYCLFQYDAYRLNFNISKKTVEQTQAERIAELENQLAGIATINNKVLRG